MLIHMDFSKNNVDYSYLYNYEYYKEQINKQHFIKKEMSFVSVINGIIFPIIANVSSGGITTEDFEFINGTGLHYNNNDYVNYNNTRIIDSNEKVIYIGYFSSVWGHCITDNIRYLWFLKDEFFMNKFKGYKLVYICDSEKMHKNFIQLLTLLGFDTSLFIAINKPTKYQEIIIPDPCFFCDNNMTRMYTKEYLDLLNLVKIYIDSNCKVNDKYQKVYLTYSNYALDRQVGEELLEKFYREKGYCVIAPEKYSFIEQLEIFHSCRYLATTVGSCSHNILFLGEKTSVVLIPRACFIPSYQFAIDEITSSNITYVDSTLSILVSKKLPNAGTFCFYISDNLLDYYGILLRKQEFTKKNIRVFLFYLRTTINKIDGFDEISQPKFYYRFAFSYLFENKKYISNVRFADYLYLIRSRIKWIIHKISTDGFGIILNKIIHKKKRDW